MTFHSPAGQPAYTAAQYEERIERLVKALEGAVPPLVLLGDYIGNEFAGCCGIPAFDRCALLLNARDALSTERAHRTAEAAGLTAESEVERARRLA